MTLRVNETTILDGNRNFINLGNGNSTGNSHFTLVNGTTSQRPVTPVNGMLRYNTTIGDFEGYLNGSWQLLAPEPQQSTSGPVKVSSAIKSSVQSTTSTTLVAVTDLSVTITPTTTSSSIRIQASINASTLANRAFYGGVFSIVKDDTTEIVRGLLSAYHASGISGPTPTYQYSSMIHMEYVDFPATTSPVKYSIYFGSTSTESNTVINSTTVGTPKSEMIVEEYSY
jgi:hypothetical protein